MIMKKLLLFTMMLLSPIVASAYDISVFNADGKLIYYKWTDNATALSVCSGRTITHVVTYKDNIVIPSSVNYQQKNYPVISIEDEAFKDCPSLNSVTIPSSVTSIGSHTFEGCSGLVSIKIPNSVTSIGEGLFAITEFRAL